MHTDAGPFLQRIRAFPDDDAPRLIFADWLDDRGGRGADRAAFIRVQIALAGVPDDDRRRPALLAAERDLLDAHRDDWEAPFRGLATGLEFRRGFVDEVKVTARQFARHAPELFAAGPIRHAHLLDVGGSLAAVVQSPFLGRLSALTVYAQHAGGGLARTLARGPHLAGLRALNLVRNRLGDDAAGHVAGARVFAGLEELDLSENALGETAARALAASPHLGRLRRLELRLNPLGPAGAEALAGSDRLAALHHLGLADTGLGAARLLGLPRASALLRVPSLDLSGNGLTPAGLRAILTRPADDPDPVRLEALNLSHNDLGEAGARVLAESPALAGLKVLRLVGCRITDEAAHALAHARPLNHLPALDLGNNPVYDRGFRAFLETPYLRGLRRLAIPGLGVSAPMRHALNQRFHRGLVRF